MKRLFAVALVIALSLALIPAAFAAEDTTEEYLTRREAITQFGRYIFYNDNRSLLYAGVDCPDGLALKIALDAKLAIGDGKGNLRLDDLITPHEYTQIEANYHIYSNTSMFHTWDDSYLPDAIKAVTPQWSWKAWYVEYGLAYAYLGEDKLENAISILVNFASQRYVSKSEALEYIPESDRDQRRQDLFRVLDALMQYKDDNDGYLPSTENWNAFVDNYLDFYGYGFIAPDGNPYRVVYGGENLTDGVPKAAEDNVIYVFRGFYFVEYNPLRITRDDCVVSFLSFDANGDVVGIAAYVFRPGEVK